MRNQEDLWAGGALKASLHASICLAGHLIQRDLIGERALELRKMPAYMLAVGRNGCAKRWFM
jgi:hypothetical protein